MKAIALAVIFLFASPLAAAETGIECAVRKPPGAREYWSYREIAGRRCWYPGRPGLAKELLRWGRSSVRVAPASTPGEIASPMAEVPTADLSGTFLDRWYLIPSIFYNPERLEQWKPLW